MITFCSWKRLSMILPARSSILFLSIMYSSTTSRDSGSLSRPGNKISVYNNQDIRLTIPFDTSTLSCAIHMKSPTLNFLTLNFTPAEINRFMIIYLFINSVQLSCLYVSIYAYLSILPFLFSSSNNRPRK